MFQVNVGVWEGKGWYTPEICFSRSPNECSRSQNINCLNIDATFTVERQNIFDLIRTR